jgi:antitoxin MazE
MQISKWGNSLAVRLPAAVIKALKLKAGDEIEIHALGKSEFGVTRKPDIDEMLKRVRRLRGRMPKDFKFDRQEANERGR